MKEQIVSFETAKTAKEKGFEQSPFNITKSYSLVYKNSDEVMIRSSLFNPESNVCTAPTQSLLQKWLREQFDKHVTVRVHRDMDHHDNYSCYIYDTEEQSDANWAGVDYEPYTVKGVYDTYEKALEEGLKEALLSL